MISEVPFDPERLAELLVRDRADNPSNYAVAAISEGATMVGGRRLEYGEEDAYGHKTLGGIGQATAEAIAKITGQKTQYQKIAYLMRSGAPDALDRMAAISFANLAMELIEKGSSAGWSPCGTENTPTSRPGCPHRESGRLTSRDCTMRRLIDPESEHARSAYVPALTPNRLLKKSTLNFFKINWQEQVLPIYPNCTTFQVAQFGGPSLLA